VASPPAGAEPDLRLRCCSALFDVHTVRAIDADPARRQSLDVLFAAWARRCAPGKGPVQPVIVAVPAAPRGPA
jgi:hypothetical protein